MNARALVLHRTADRFHHFHLPTSVLPGQRRVVAPVTDSAPETALHTDLAARLAQRRGTVLELAEALREHSLVAELVAGSRAA